jgi:hypothetical protein
MARRLVARPLQSSVHQSLARLCLLLSRDDLSDGGRGSKTMSTETGGPVRPWIGYDDQDVATIARFVAKSSPTQARTVSAYERAHMDRPAVVAATARRLEKLHA